MIELNEISKLCVIFTAARCPVLGQSAIWQLLPKSQTSYLSRFARPCLVLIYPVLWLQAKLEYGWLGRNRSVEKEPRKLLKSFSGSIFCDETSLRSRKGLSYVLRLLSFLL